MPCTSPTTSPAPCTASATTAPSWWPKVSTSPKGSAAANGSIYVVEAGNGRVTAINPANGESATVAGPLELHVPPSGAFPNTMLFNGIATDGETAWVSGDAANTIYVFDLN